MVRCYCDCIINILDLFFNEKFMLIFFLNGIFMKIFNDSIEFSNNGV